MSDATLKQNKPKPGNQTVWPEVMADLAERARLGKSKYGTDLQTNNGRDALIDAYQEVLDLAQYIKQHILENRVRAASVAGLPTLQLVAIANLCADAILAREAGGDKAKISAQSVRDNVPKASPTVTMSILQECIAEINDRMERPS